MTLAPDKTAPSPAGLRAAQRKLPPDWLSDFCTRTPDVLFGAIALPGPEGFEPAAVWPDGGRIGVALAETMHAALRRGESVVRLAGSAGESPAATTDDNDLIAVPVRRNGELNPTGVVAVTAMKGAAGRATAIAAALTEALGRMELPESVRNRNPARQTGVMLELIAVCLEHRRLRAAGTALVTAIAGRLQCDRVSLGLHARGRVRVCAISHSARFDPRSDLCRRLGAAMDETLDCGSTIQHGDLPPETPLPVHAHQQIREFHGAGYVCSIPLPGAAGPVGVLTLERAQPLPAAQIEILEHLAVLAAPVLALMTENERSPLRRLSDTAQAIAAKLLGPGRLAWKSFAVALVLAVAALGLGSGTHRLTATAHIEGQVQRAIVAPIDGFIGEAFVRAGDRVKAGDELARLDDRDLVVERRRWESERVQRQREYRSALAAHERSSASVLSAQIDKAAAQIDLIDAQLARVRLIAPLDGIVVSGDLSQSLGSPVSRGEPLFEVAPLDAWRVVLEVDERDIGFVQPGQRGSLTLGAMPDRTAGFSVADMYPIAQTHDGRNIFRVEAVLDQAPDSLRPGMEGIGKIEIGERRLGWLLFHDLVARAKLLFWGWWG